MAKSERPCSQRAISEFHLYKTGDLAAWSIGSKVKFNTIYQAMSLGINDKIFWCNRGIHPGEAEDWKCPSVVIDHGHYKPLV